jgi:membrane protein YqaA with SNARE-associated domain
MSIFNGLLEWTETIFAPLGAWGLFILAFIESAFFPIPPDVLLIILTLADPSLALWFALICTIGSTLGGLLGYAIGYYLGKPILYKLFKENKIKKVHNLFEKYEEWTIFIAGFTPIPYKIFTIASGTLFINLKKFVLFSFLSRGLRFFAIAIFIKLYGEAIVGVIDKYFGFITIAIILVLLLIYYVYRKIKKEGKIDFFSGDL